MGGRRNAETCSLLDYLGTSVDFIYEELYGHGTYSTSNYRMDDYWGDNWYICSRDIYKTPITSVFWYIHFHGNAYF